VTSVLGSTDAELSAIAHALIGVEVLVANTVPLDRVQVHWPDEFSVE
jgi:hypothetical protein